MHKPSASLADALLCPPPKFGQVEPSVFRAAFPRSESLAHLRLLGLRTALNLSRELPAQDVLAWFEAQGVRVAHLGIAVWTHPSVTPISAELVNAALSAVLDREQHPLLLLSASGTHEVGTIVGCLRRLQQWSLSGAIDEYRSFAAPTPRLSCEQFIETWDPDLAPPPRAHPPPWFESQHALLESDAEAWRRMPCCDAEEAARLREYFRVSGALCSPGVATTLVAEDAVAD